MQDVSLDAIINSKCVKFFVNICNLRCKGKLKKQEYLFFRIKELLLCFFRTIVLYFEDTLCLDCSSFFLVL